MASKQSICFYVEQYENNICIQVYIDRMEINEDDKQNLKKVMEQFQDEYQDNTEYIRNAKNSIKIRDEILKMERLKRSYEGDLQSEDFIEKCRVECNYLFTNYLYIFNKLVKDVINLKLMFQFLQILREVEEGRINQEEGSVYVGKILKEIYLDCAVREAEALDAKYDADRPPPPIEGKCISWKQYRARNKKQA